MGCVSSKLYRRDLNRDIIINNGGGEYLNHVVSLTSSTYGLLNLDIEKTRKENAAENKEKSSPSGEVDPEIINAWELMEDLKEEIPMSSIQSRKSPKARVFLRGDSRSPLKFLNQIGSPRKAKKFGGKENNKGMVNSLGRFGYSPKDVMKGNNNFYTPENSCKSVLKLNYPVKSSPIFAKRESFGSDCSRISSRRSLSPLFDPDLVASYERELSEEGEQIKTTVSEAPRTRKPGHSLPCSETVLQLFDKKCPPGGENAVVIYTTTLRGIRKTFEDCNTVRSIIESHQIHLLERDVSMDSGFKEEVRKLMGTKEVKVPLVFVKGRLIGGANEVVKLEEECKLGILFDGIARAVAGGCEGCAGVRFVMCMECNGSCKVLDELQKKMVKCGACNENGLIQCSICCSV